MGVNTKPQTIGTGAEQTCRARPPVLADSPSASGMGLEESQGLCGLPSAAFTMTTLSYLAAL